ncbi:hypothetical protein ACHAPU_010901 [Fusarium lateritium]
MSTHNTRDEATEATSVPGTTAENQYGHFARPIQQTASSVPASNLTVLSPVYQPRQRQVMPYPSPFQVQAPGTSFQTANASAQVTLAHPDLNNASHSILQSDYVLMSAEDFMRPWRPSQGERQRVTIACLHCRGRKIRCSGHTNTIEGKCRNCYRLGKTCVFQPPTYPPVFSYQQHPMSFQSPQLQSDPTYSAGAMTNAVQISEVTQDVRTTEPVYLM